MAKLTKKRRLSIRHPPSSHSRTSLISAENIVVAGGTFNQHNSDTHEVPVLDFLYPNIDPNLFYNSKIYEDISSDISPMSLCGTSIMDDEYHKVMQWSTTSRLGRTTPVIQRDFPSWPSKRSSTKLALKVARELSRKELLLASIILPSNDAQYDRHKIISTFAFQMAISIPSTQQYIMDALKDPSIFDRNTETQIQKLIQEPIIHAALNASSEEKRRWPSIVVVDGLYDSQLHSMAWHINETLHKVSRREDLDFQVPFCVLVTTSKNIRAPWMAFIFDGYRKLLIKRTIIGIGIIFDLSGPIALHIVYLPGTCTKKFYRDFVIERLGLIDK